MGSNALHGVRHIAAVNNDATGILQNVLAQGIVKAVQLFHAREVALGELRAGSPYTSRIA